MARIAGVDLPRKKRIDIGLTHIYGIGRSLAAKILKATKIDPSIRVENLSEEDGSRLRDYIVKNVQIEGNLRREVGLNVKRLVEINCYRGKRHRLGLPVRGQNTKNNARTRKGPRKIIKKWLKKWGVRK